jgi:hypothetical protein
MNIDHCYYYHDSYAIKLSFLEIILVLHAYKISITHPPSVSVLMGNESANGTSALILSPRRSCSVPAYIMEKLLYDRPEKNNSQYNGGIYYCTFDRSDSSSSLPMN